MYSAVKRFWMFGVGALLFVGAGVYWVKLQNTPRYVAMRAADALYGGAGLAGLEFHDDELRELGITQARAVEIVERIRAEYLPAARMVSEPEFRKQPGKDVLAFQVEVRPGVNVRSVVEVIEEDGRGVILFGDMVASLRATLYQAAKQSEDPAPVFESLNGVRDLLVSQGVAGYWDMSRNRLDSWPVYDLSGQRT